MKFLITGALNRPGGPRGVLTLGLLLFVIYELCNVVLNAAESEPPGTLALAVEDTHVLLFFRGLEALFLVSVTIGLPLPVLMRRGISIALFAIPLVSFSLLLVSVWQPAFFVVARSASILASIAVILSAAVVVRSMYAR